MLYTSFFGAAILDVNTSSKRKIVSSQKGYTCFYSNTSNHNYVAFTDNLVVYDSLFNATTIQNKDTPIFATSLVETKDSIYL